MTIEAQNEKHMEDLAAENEWLRNLLRQIITDLPSNRDWLDPQVERAAREAIKEKKGRPLPVPPRLQQALELLRYHKPRELHHQSNLIHAIELFAGVSHDAELETECEHEIQRIRAKVKEKYAD